MRNPVPANLKVAAGAAAVLLATVGGAYAANSVASTDRPSSVTTPADPTASVTPSTDSDDQRTAGPGSESPGGRPTTDPNGDGHPDNGHHYGQLRPHTNRGHHYGQLMVHPTAHPGQHPGEHAGGHGGRHGSGDHPGGQDDDPRD